MKWLAAVLALLTFSSQADMCYKLDNDQRKVLVSAYEKGRDHDLGYTMMAIAWNESSAGKYRVNLESHDFGVMQNSLKTASARTDTKGYFNKMRLIEDLIKNDELSMSLALEELLYWRGKTGTWRNMVSAYNNGWAYSKGHVYLTKIIRHVKMFQRCLGGLVNKIEYLHKLNKKYPMPLGATHYAWKVEETLVLDIDWRKSGAYYSHINMAWAGYHRATIGTTPIPLEFLMDNFLENHNA